MSQRRIDSYFLRSSSRSSSTASTVIDVDSDASTDDEQQSAAISSSKKRRASSTATSRRRARKRRAVFRTTSSHLPIESYFVPSVRRSSSLPAAVAEWKWDSDDEQKPLSVLAARILQLSSQSPSQLSAAASRRAQPVVRRALSNISNVPRRDVSVYSARRRKAYVELRAQLAHPANRAMCAYCGVRKHSAIHHESEFRRAGAVSSTMLRPSAVQQCVLRPVRSHCQVSACSACCADPFA
jgi:hypothetical protein